MIRHDDERPRRDRLEMLHAVRQAVADPVRLVTLVRGCDTREEALAEVRRAYGVSMTAAVAMLDTQVVRFTATGRRRVDEEIAALAAADAGGTP